MTETIVWETTSYRHRRVPPPPMGFREWLAGGIEFCRARREGRRMVRRARARARKGRHAR